MQFTFSENILSEKTFGISPIIVYNILISKTVINDISPRIKIMEKPHIHQLVTYNAHVNL